MGVISFKDWIAARESSAFTRSRRAAALGLGPDIPDAAIHSRSTAAPFEVEKLTDKKKDDCKCKGKCKKCKDKKRKSLDEARNTKIDDFLNAVGALKDDTKRLASDKSKVKADTSKEEPKAKSTTEEPDANAKPAGKKCKWVCED